MRAPDSATIEASLDRSTHSTHSTHSARSTQSMATRSLVAILVAFVGLSLGSTIAKSSGSPGPVVAFWRLLIGAVLWHTWIWVRGALNGSPRAVDASAWRVATLPGIAFGVNLSCFFSGVTRTPIAHAEFVSALTPLVLLPLAALTLNERVQRHVVIGGVVAVSGVALILSQAPSGGTSYFGDFLVACSMLAWVVYLITAKAARSHISTHDFMAAMSTVACVTTLPISLITAGGPGELFDLSAKGWLLVALLAITAGMISHGLIAWAQPRLPVGTVSMLQLGQPGLGVLWAATLLDESVKPIQLVGMAIVLGAVASIARRSAATHSQERPPGTARLRRGQILQRPGARPGP